MAEEKTFQKFIEDLYSKPLKDEDVFKFYETYRYQGFERGAVLKELYERLKDPKLVSELIILCAIQSPTKASAQKMSNGLTPIQMGITASGQKGTKNLSCTRITAVTADLAAYYLKKIKNLPKKIGDSDLPAWLQFPSAACINLPKKLREQHKEFSIKFSDRINLDGKHPFNHDLYEIMMANSYLDERLELFDEE